MTRRQKKFVCWLSTGRRVTVIANRSERNPSVMFGQLDADPRHLRQPELDEFLTWWRDLEAQHLAQGIRLDLKVCAQNYDSNHPTPFSRTACDCRQRGR